MIDLMMRLGSEVIIVRINGNSVHFGNTSYGAQMATIEGLKLSKNGVEKEFPELKDNPNWRIEAISKFKDKIKDLKSEDRIAEYVLEDLAKFGYTPMYRQKAGFRKEVIKAVIA